MQLKWVKHCGVLAVAVTSMTATAQTTGVQCAFRDVIGSFPSERVNDVAVVGQTAFITDHNAFRALDMSDPANPTEVGSIPVLGGPLTIRDGLAYVTAGGAGIHIVDISDPSSMAVVGAYDTPGSAFEVELVGQLAFVADYNAGLVIVDVSDPANPTFVGQADSWDDVQSVQVVGDFAYCAIGYGGFLIIDVSDPGHPEVLHRVDLDSYYTNDVQVAGDIAYMADSAAGLMIVDIRDPGVPRLLTRYETSLYGSIKQAQSIEVIDGLAYLSAEAVHVLDVTDPSAPMAIGEYDLDWWVRRVELNGDLLYCADVTKGLHVIDVSEPKSGSVIGFDDDSRPADLAVGDGFLVTTFGSSGIYVYDISDPAAPVRRSRYDTPGSARYVRVEDRLAYVSDDLSLLIFDMTDLAAPALLGSYEDGEPVLRADVADDVLYYASAREGLKIIDVSDPADPTLITEYNPGERVLAVVAGEGLAYVLVENVGMQILDVSDPASPHLVSVYESGVSFGHGFAVHNDDYLVTYVWDWRDEHRLEIVDVREPSSPVRVGELRLPSAAVVGDIAVAGELAVVGAGLMEVVDLSDPIAPMLVGRYAATFNAVEAVGDIAFAANDEVGVFLLDISDCPPCRADCDGSGDLNFFDFLCYQNLFAAGDPEADCDGSGGLDFFDFLCFQNAFAAGCE